MRRFPIAILICANMLAACSRQPTAGDIASTFEKAPVAIDGIGPIKVGMTHKQAEEASGEPIVLRGDAPSDAEACRFGALQTGPKGLSFMLIGETIVRIDVDGDTAIKTSAGAHIGSTEDEVKTLYGARLAVTPHKYDPNGHYLTVSDSDPAQRYQYIFETDGRMVKSFRAGRLPEVAVVEGCG
jgi:hypothetical protein